MPGPKFGPESVRDGGGPHLAANSSWYRDWARLLGHVFDEAHASVSS